MEAEVCEVLRREIEELEELLSGRIAEWLRMKQQYESWCVERRAERSACTDVGADEELIWEKGSSVREYHRLYIEPLESQLSDKRRNMAMFGCGED